MERKDPLFQIMINEILEKERTGWDFSEVLDTGRVAVEPLPWGFSSRILYHLSSCKSLLIMGASAAHLLVRLTLLPSTTTVTEEKRASINSAKTNLLQHGIKIVQVYKDGKLPFINGSYELIINLNKSYDPEEVYRLLVPGGKFITQQSGGIYDLELNKRLSAPLNPRRSNWNLQIAVKQLEKLGFITSALYEAFPKIRFYDLGAVIYYLKENDGQIQKFKLDRYMDEFYQIHSEIMAKGYIEIKSYRFFIEATKP